MPTTLISRHPDVKHLGGFLRGVSEKTMLPSLPGVIGVRTSAKASTNRPPGDGGACRGLAACPAPARRVPGRSCPESTPVAPGGRAGRNRNRPAAGALWAVTRHARPGVPPVASSPAAGGQLQCQHSARGRPHVAAKRPAPAACYRKCYCPPRRHNGRSRWEHFGNPCFRGRFASWAQLGNTVNAFIIDLKSCVPNLNFRRFSNGN
jgi:hypothetical protein